MPNTTQHSTPTTSTFESFTRQPDREPGEQQHGYPFKPHRMPEAPLETSPEEELDEPDRRPAQGDVDFLDQDIDGIIHDIPT